ncbi:MAG: sensor histidine kinase, partial [Blastocatellia bacterium]|nr:sensor histidine kinase [Blastocatellia bacterium]
EALTNVARHSNATYVQIKLHSYQDKLLLTIADNGVGLMQNKPTGLGLVGMRARAQQIDAEFSLQNQPLGGVKIEISAPLRLLEKEV